MKSLRGVGEIRQLLRVNKKSGPTRRTVRPLIVRTTGAIRTRDLHFRQKVALSAELQRYAERRLGLNTNTKYFQIKTVD